MTENRTKIIRRNQLKQIVGLSPSSVARMEAAGDFPSRRQFGPGTVGWLEEEVDAWIRSKPFVKRGTNG